MRSKYRVTYDSDKGAEFNVHTPNGIIRFPETEEGVYAIDMANKTENKNIKNNFFSVLNNKQIFSYLTKQLKQAKKVKEKSYMH